LRLGLRLIAGFGEEDANRLVAARRQGGPFLTPEDLMRRAKLAPAALRTLARADVFGSLDLGRRETLWHVAGLEADVLPLVEHGAIMDANEAPRSRPREGGDPSNTLHLGQKWIPACAGMTEQRMQPSSLGAAIQERLTLPPYLPLDCFAAEAPRNDAGHPQPAQDDVELPPLRDEESVTEDYSAFGLSLRNHPMAFMRGTLRAKGMATAADLKSLPDGRYVKIAGLVLFRQRPGTAKGTIFVTIEDETGAANLIVWPKIATQYRRAVFAAKVLLCEGILQKESNVIHVVSRHLTDWTPMVKSLQSGQSDALHLQLDRNGQSFHSLCASFHTRKSVHALWTNSLKSRDFR
jgi:error-prone DNA polymerase